MSNPPLNDTAELDKPEDAGDLLGFLGIEPGELEVKSYEELEIEFMVEQAASLWRQYESAIGEGLYKYRDCGRKLLEIKDKCQHGQFGAAIAAQFPASLRHAQRCMRVARHWDEILGQAKATGLSLLSIESALSIIAQPKEVPQLPPAPDLEVIDAEIVEDGEPSPLTPLPGGEGDMKLLSNPDAHNEHYTPDRILEMVYRCFGGFPDLDPCSNEDGEPNVRATVHYGPSRNGLLQPWMGRVFANPPYNPAGTLGDWTAKLLEQYRLGNVSQAIYLVPAYTDTAWWRQLNEFPVCLVKGRLVFKGNTEAARFPSAVFYLGHNASAFGAAFAELGDFWMQTLLED